MNPRERFQTELAAHVLLYIQRLWSEDPASLRAIGVPDAVALWLQDLPMRELLRIGHYGRNTVLAGLRIDHACLKALLDASHTPDHGVAEPQPHTALVEHLLITVTRSLEDALNEPSHAHGIGLTDDEVAALWTLTPVQMRRIATARAHFLDVRYEAAQLLALIRHVEHAQAEEAEQKQLLLHRAPSAVMRHLYGWSNGDFASRRRLLELRSTGRTPGFRTEQLALRAERLWRELERQQPSLSLAQRLLKLSGQLDVGIDTLWQAVGSKPEKRKRSRHANPNAQCPPQLRAKPESGQQPAHSSS